MSLERPGIVRTPEERFANLPGYPYAPRYTIVGGLRIHHVEEGPASADPVLLLHGEPTWSYLYRKMIPVLARAGHRAIAPDLVGFGRSDKPAERSAYSYAGHVAWMAQWLEQNDLRNITLVGQDWGSLIGLRLAAEHPGRFARIVIANGFLPEGKGRLPLVFRLWQGFARWSPLFPVSAIVRAGCARRPAPEVLAAYAAPFPDQRSMAGARVFPLLVPTRPADPAVPANRRAWEVLQHWEKPFLTVFGDRDPIFRGADRVLQRRIPGAAGQPHRVLRGAGHFIQEDKGEELAEIIVAFLAGG